MGCQLGMPYPYVFSPTQPPVILSNESRRATIDPFISDKESLTPSSAPVTPSSVPATQLPPHSSQEEREKDQVFLKRIADYYNKHRPTGSMTSSYQRLKSHYYSDWSDENVLENALNMWKANNKGKDFKYMYMWRVLKEYEKYTPQSVAHYSNKKARTSKSGGNTSTSNPDTSVDLDDSEVRIRPIGQKAAKRKDNSKAREGDTMEHCIDKE
ncbi:uncharacterized protein LOC122054672 [Zingiber officinale]|uniref:uncharacterized protein LOC122054672 n=1 Tax=Zingiber officinale TaxID=94328 RepID=UPI001C4AA4DA|nr:uncharacterized protein LOC122054672 [Zingiber officinale]